MSVQIDARIIRVLREAVRTTPCMDRMWVQDWYAEKEWLLREFIRLDSVDSWWADSEYEWFINRTLNFLERCDPPAV